MRRLPDYAMALLSFYAGGDAIQTWHSAFADPGARMFRIAQYQDSALLVWLMGIVGVILISDVLVNDVLPDTFKIGQRNFILRWKKAFEHRHFLFGILAFAYAVQPWIMSAAGRPVEALSFFYWNACQTIILAFFDVKLRTRGVKWQRA
jgi:hypothetical protein